jgi:hypothetical protein
MSAAGIFSNSCSEIYRTIFAGPGTNNKDMFSKIRLLSEQFGVFPAMSEQSDGGNTTSSANLTTKGTQTNNSNTSIDQVRIEAELMAHFVVDTFGEENAKIAPNKYCKTIIRTVNELSVKHAMVFKGIFNKLEVNDDDVLQTFVIVADEIFEEGQVNWGRIVSVYAFAGHLARHISNKINNNPGLSDNQEENATPLRSTLIKGKIASFVGQYVANKLGQWIVDQGGWDAFVKYFPEPQEFETKIWKFGLLAAIGLGTMATVIGNK